MTQYIGGNRLAVCNGETATVAFHHYLPISEVKAVIVLRNLQRSSLLQMLL